MMKTTFLLALFTITAVNGLAPHSGKPSKTALSSTVLEAPTTVTSAPTRKEESGALEYEMDVMKDFPASEFEILSKQRQVFSQRIQEARLTAAQRSRITYGRPVFEEKKTPQVNPDVIKARIEEARQRTAQVTLEAAKRARETGERTTPSANGEHIVTPVYAPW